MDSCDVAIVEGGPGGLAAASCINIARPNMRVRVAPGSFPSHRTALRDACQAAECVQQSQNTTAQLYLTLYNEDLVPQLGAALMQVLERAKSMRPAGLAIGILPNALNSIRAMDAQLYHKCLAELTPAEDEQSNVWSRNTGECRFKCARLQMSRSIRHLRLSGMIHKYPVASNSCLVRHPEGLSLLCECLSNRMAM